MNNKTKRQRKTERKETEKQRKMLNEFKSYFSGRNTIVSLIFFILSISLSLLLGYLLKINGAIFDTSCIFVTIFLAICMYLYFKPGQAVSAFILILNNQLMFLLLIALICIIIFTIYFYYTYYTTNGDIFASTNYILDFFLLSLIVVFGLTLFYIKYKDNKLSTTAEIIFQILFFIPCLITDFIDWVKGEMKITPSTVYIVSFIEIILIFLFFYLSSIMQWLSNHDPMIRVMPEPVFLKTETKVMTAEKFNGLIVDKVSGNKNPKTTYSLGFWLYLNDNNGSDQLQLPVLSYGHGKLLDASKVNNQNPYGNYNVHPAIVFLPNKQKNNVLGGDLKNVSIGHLGIYFSNVETPVILDVPMQRWNYMVLNTTYSMVDVFLNGEIVYTHHMNGSPQQPLPIYNVSDYITVGGNNMQGAIKDITYCDYALSKTSIVSIYNMNMFTSKLLPAYILQ